LGFFPGKNEGKIPDFPGKNKRKIPEGLLKHQNPSFSGNNELAKRLHCEVREMNTPRLRGIKWSHSI